MATTVSLAQRYLTERLATRSLSRATAQTVRYVLGTFTAIAPADPTLIKPRHVSKWAGSRDLSPTTLRNRISIVRMFCQWLVLHDHVLRDPSLGLAKPREPDRMPRALPAEHIGLLLRHCPDARGRLIVCLMVELGLRRAEVTRVQMGDIDLRAGIILVHGKGDKDRWLPLTAATRTALAGYLSEHPATTGPLVRSYSDPRAPLAPAHVGRLVSRWMKAAGIKAAGGDGVSAHALRHTAASDVFDHGADVRQVQAMLGHSSLQTTQRYLRRPDAGKLLAVMEGRDYTLT